MITFVYLYLQVIEMARKVIKFIDLFAGIGGIRLGLEQALKDAGYQVIDAEDIKAGV